MRIIAVRTLLEFGERHPQTMSAIRAWYKDTRSREIDWLKPQDVVEKYGEGRVDILRNDRVCIDLRGNNVRLILKVKYGYGVAYVRWIGWHKDHDKLGDSIHTL